MSHEYHTPVLRDEVLQYIITTPGGTYVDGTLGGGGHCEAMLTRLSAGGRVIAFDVDADAVEYARGRLSSFGERVTMIRESYSFLKRELGKAGAVVIRGLLLDLGVSSRQIDDPARGFSFQSDARLDMRMDRRRDLDAWTVVNTYPQERLAGVLREYGEEPRSRRIARSIVERRPIETTGDLAGVVRGAAGSRFSLKSVARVFQALRIEVNGELENVRRALRDGVELLEQGGRLCVISYHSLEDRIVKQFFRQESATSVPSGHPLLPDLPRTPNLRVLTARPVRPSAAEIAANPRARSARLRAAERL